MMFLEFYCGGCRESYYPEWNDATGEWDRHAECDVAGVYVGWYGRPPVGVRVLVAFTGGEPLAVGMHYECSEEYLADERTPDGTRVECPLPDRENDWDCAYAGCVQERRDEETEA